MTLMIILRTKSLIAWAAGNLGLDRNDAGTLLFAIAPPEIMIAMAKFAEFFCHDNEALLFGQWICAGAKIYFFLTIESIREERWTYKQKALIFSGLRKAQVEILIAN